MSKEYEVVYLDNREGDLRRTVVEAEDEGEAIEMAMDEDYYFGKFIEVIEA